jgi:hypothetical protein
MERYLVTIEETSRELTAKERVQLKDTTDALKLDEVTQFEAITIKPVLSAVLNIHNEKSDNKDYKNYVLVDESGQRYVTGSDSFWSSYKNIENEMAGSTEEWAIKVYRKPSKNYNGKEFITCSIV